jgi:hypothetical protein
MAKWSRLRILADSLADAYWTWNSGGGDNLNNSMVLKNAVALTASPTLEYSVKYSIEKNYDYAYVEISKDAGASWDILKTYTNVLTEWGSETIDLSSYVNYSVIVRFRYTTDSSFSLSGFDIKNITIKNNGNSLFTDTGNVNDWTLVGFDWVEKDPMIPYGTVSFDEQTLGCDLTNNTLYSVWTIYNVDNEINELAFSKSIDNGLNWSIPQTIISIAGYNQRNPFLLVHNNTLHLVWTGTDATNTINYQIKYSKSTDDGTTWSNWVNVSSIASYKQAYPSIVQDSLGSLHMAWFGKDGDSTSQQTIKYSKSADGGANWSAYSNIFSELQNIRQGSNVGEYQPLYPSLNVDSNNNLHLIWFGYDGGYRSLYTKSTDGGSTWSARTHVITYPYGISDMTPKSAIDSDNNLYFITNKTRQDGYGQIVFSKSTDGGINWSTPAVIAERGDDGFGSFPWSPDITVDNNGNIHVVWYNPHIYYVTSTDGGLTWGSIVQLAFDGIGYFSLPDPHICADNLNNLHLLCVCETDRTGGYNYEPLYANYLVDVAPSLTIPKKCAMRVLINGLWRRVIKR